MTAFSDDYKAWLLSDDRQPVTLIEADHQGGTVLVADGKYISQPWDRVPNMPYLDILSRNVRMKKEYLGSAVGLVKLSNENGDLDDWADYKWDGRSIRIFHGDRRWNRSQFQLITNQLNGGATTPSPDTLEWTILDNDEMLDREIGSDSNPITIGMVFNAEAKLIDPVRQIYSSNDGSMKSYSEIRDNGALLTEGTGYTLDLAKGNFRLLNSPDGKITFDGIQKDKTAGLAIINILNRIDVPYNKANLKYFANNDDIGLYISTPTSARSLLNQIASSVGAKITYNQSGSVGLVRRESLGEPIFVITPEHIEINSLLLEKAIKPKSKVIVNYKKNWSVQTKDELASGITDAYKDSYSTEFQEVEHENDMSLYLDSGDLTIDSYIHSKTAAENECKRLAQLYSSETRFYRLRVSISALELWHYIGKTISIIYPRFGFEKGLSVGLESIEFDLSSERVELIVWR